MRQIEEHVQESANLCETSILSSVNTCYEQIERVIAQMGTIDKSTKAVL